MEIVVDGLYSERGDVMKLCGDMVGCFESVVVLKRGEWMVEREGGGEVEVRVEEVVVKVVGVEIMFICWDNGYFFKGLKLNRVMWVVWVEWGVIEV